MIRDLQVMDKVKLKNDQILTVHKIFKAENTDKNIYGLGLNADCPGNFEWYYENGKPVTYWADKKVFKALFDPKVIIDIIKVNN